MTLTETEWHQLLVYADWAKQSGDFYGRRDYFAQRHARIVWFLEKQIEESRKAADATQGDSGPVRGNLNEGGEAK